MTIDNIFMEVERDRKKQLMEASTFFDGLTDDDLSRMLQEGSMMEQGDGVQPDEYQEEYERYLQMNYYHYESMSVRVS